MTDKRTLLDALAAALQEATKVNGSTQVKPAAVLWPDTDRQWLPVFMNLRERCNGLLQLGAYDPKAFRGPAIWLKCLIGGSIAQDEAAQGAHIVHLPGVSRADLRAIETCPRDLQPLAELQYRGVFWSQSNGKDWTVNAFLTSKNGGLGLDVAQDKATQEALIQAVEAGVLLERPVVELMGRSINAAWLNSLLAPNPTRDLLVWMNDPEAAHAKWSKQQWAIFDKRAKADFGFDPKADGVLVAAEKLAKAEGQWAAVSELYKDSFGSFPKIFDLLAQVQPPQRNLFDGFEGQEGYPQANEGGESSLRYALAACGPMMPDQARDEIAKIEKEHGVRRSWLWARMGQAPLATALEFLAKVASASKQLPVGATPDALALSYQQTGWQVDAAAMRALAAVTSKVDIAAVSLALRAVYLPWLEESAKRLQDAVKAAGGLSVAAQANGAEPVAGVCTVFVDGLRYDVATRLQELLGSFGTTTLDAAWTSMPSVTASGKAWCSPVARWISGNLADTEFQPRVSADGKSLSTHNFRKLLADHGVQFLDKHETGDAAGAAWTETGDLDHYGHQHGIRLARDMEVQLAQVVERILELEQSGWKKFRIVTDHGWLLLPGGLPKSELPKHQAETRWGRCAVLKDSAHGTPLTFGWDWCNDVQVAYAPGVSSFVAGSDYAHGGISLQECWVPVLNLESGTSAVGSAKATIDSVTWKGLRCTAVVSSQSVDLNLDIRTKPAQSSSSLVAQPKLLVDGKASLAIVDDDQLGAAAVVVVLDAQGNVIQKLATTVGG
ncbi:BREX-1 system phosphatase PglZ type B [Limnohabitans parvus]|uniref:BREX-1 system phosphatase PglZ type B n=1 Tax=Limnohabitans parvus TaxID=540061 RepID=UPI000D334A8C|nr:BREX-1 system phosphatase PglZ type B [Limnohabitans parvus]